MRTVDLTQNKHTLDDLLDLAGSEALVIQTADGRRFVLEKMDSFEQEVVALGASEKFMSFLEERSREEANVSVQDIALNLNITDI